MTDFDGRLWIFENPVPGEVYVAGVDVAYGDRKDSSTVQIVKASTLEQVAEYDSNTIIPDKFADVVIDLTKRYNNCLVNIERNAVGKILIDKILNKTNNGIGVNLFRDKSKNELTAGYDYGRDLYRSSIGTDVTGVSRDILLANMYNIIIDKYTEAVDSIISAEEDKFDARRKFEMIMQNRKSDSVVKKYGIIKSERLHHQLLNFVVDEHGRADGPRTDLIFAWVHALYAFTKSKQLLLRNFASILSRTVGVEDSRRNQLESIKFVQEHSNSNIWNSLRPEDIQKILDEEYGENLEINNAKDDREKPEESSSLSNIYKAFYKGKY